MADSEFNTSFSNLDELFDFFSSNKFCKEYLAQKRWNGSIVCPHCNYDEKIYSMKSGYKCAQCKKPFSVTKGTFFENSSIPLQKWFAAIWLVTNIKEGISSMQLHRELNITQKSAWLMLDKLRKVSLESFDSVIDKPKGEIITHPPIVKDARHTSLETLNRPETTPIDQKYKFTDWLTKFKK